MLKEKTIPVTTQGNEKMFEFWVKTAQRWEDLASTFGTPQHLKVIYLAHAKLARQNAETWRPKK